MALEGRDTAHLMKRYGSLEHTTTGRSYRSQLTYINYRHRGKQVNVEI